MRSKKLSAILGAVGLLAVSSHAHAEPVTAAVAIGTAYKVYKGVKEAIDFFKSFGPTEVEQAVAELERFERNFRDQALVNSVNADLRLYGFIAGNYQSALTNDLEANFISSAITDLAQMEGDMRNGTIDDYYMLMPAYNLLTITFVGAVKSFGMMNPANAYPQSTLDSYLNAAASLDYQAVGGGLVYYDFCPGCSQQMVFGTQGGKTMWTRYAPHSGAWSVLLYPSTAIAGTYSCDMNNPANVDHYVFSACTFKALFAPPTSAPSPVASLPTHACIGRNCESWVDVYSVFSTALNDAQNKFLADPAVDAIDQALTGIMDNGLTVWVVDYNPFGGQYPFGIGHLLWAL
jgi:hypothetical protein